eukprot:g33493.t1
MTITQEKVLGKLKDLKVDKSPRPDGLHSRVLKEIAKETMEALSITKDEIAEYSEVHGTKGIVVKFAVNTKIDVEEARRLQKDLGKVGEWAKKWRMEYQVIKCQVMNFGMKIRGGPEEVYKDDPRNEGLFTVEWLRILGPCSMEFRRMMKDLVETYRILRGLDRVDMEKMFPL